MFDQAITSTIETPRVAQTSIQGTNALAVAFMKRLATDDTFRAETVADPVAAAAKYGFAVNDRQFPENGITLPPKAMIEEHLEMLAKRFAEAAHPVIIFRI